MMPPSHRLGSSKLFPELQQGNKQPASLYLTTFKTIPENIRVCFFKSSDSDKGPNVLQESCRAVSTLTGRLREVPRRSCSVQLWSYGK